MTETYGFAPTEKMLTPTTLAEMLAISDRHLTDVRREDETFPAPVMLGTLPRWSPAAIRRWMDHDACSKCVRATAMPVSTTATGMTAATKGAKKTKRAQRVH